MKIACSKLEGKYLASSQEIVHQPTLFLWDLDRKKLVQRISHPHLLKTSGPPSTSRLVHLYLSSRAKYIISASDKHELMFWERGKKTPFTLAGHRQKIHQIQPLLQETRVISASEDHTIRVWDLFDRAVLKILSTDQNPIYSFQVLDGEKTLVAVQGSVDQLGVFSLSDLESAPQFSQSALTPQHVQLTYDGKYAISFFKNTLQIMACASLQRMDHTFTDINEIDRIHILNDSTILCRCLLLHFESSLRLVHLHQKKWEELASSRSFGVSPGDLYAFSCHGTFMAACGRILKVWNLKTKKILATHMLDQRTYVSRMKFCKRRGSILIGASDGSIHEFDFVHAQDPSKKQLAQHIALFS